MEVMEYCLTPFQLVVIIATKNRPKLLKERSINSVLNQTRLPNCILVVDDSSEPFHLENKNIVESIQSTDFQAHHLLNQRTNGASGAWNTALDFLTNQHVNQTTPTLLAFLDDDDEWHSNYLGTCLSVVNKHRCNMVTAGFYRYENDEIPPTEYLPPESLNEDLFLRGNPGIQGSNLFLSLEIMLMAGGFDERLQSCTDRDLCIRLCETGLVKYARINKPLLIHYAESGRQRLSTPNSKAKENGLAVFWQKYHSRMNASQREAFLKRAKDLFDWQPSNNANSLPKRSHQIGLTLGIELGNIPFCQLKQIILSINQVGENTLVGFNLVLTSKQTLNLTELNDFLDFVNKQGITCYKILNHTTFIDAATELVVKQNIGHEAWVLKQLQPQELNPLNNDNIITRILLEIGAQKQSNIDQIIPNEALSKIILRCRIDAAINRINRLFKIAKLQLLGVGSEAIVLTDGNRVFKCIDYWKTRVPINQIEFLKIYGSHWNDLPGLYALDEVISDGKALILTYPYENSIPYKGGLCDQIIDLLHSCSLAGIICNNIHPKNLIKTSTEVKLIDYGSDIRPWSELGFEHMARRAYLTAFYADNPNLKTLMRQSLETTDFLEMQGYDVFRNKLVGIDSHLKQSKNMPLTLSPPLQTQTPYKLFIGVISGDAIKILPLLNSIAEFTKCSFLSNVSTLILCNGCTESSIQDTLRNSIRPLPHVQIISEAKQTEDAENGLFGIDLEKRPYGRVGIAHARSMLQKYVGLKCEEVTDSFAWILDDDMRLDVRAESYLAWLPTFKDAGIDVLVGQYEGSSPNPPLNGLRGQLLDLLNNLKWIDNLPNHIELPDRSKENKKLRELYPDYYYDLSRKHTAHVEAPFWLEPIYCSETVAEARARLFINAPLLITGYPLTRGIQPTCPSDPIFTARDTVNRGGNTFILKSHALTKTPNLSPKINDRETRRSDMVWSIINKYHYGLKIKSVPFPILHTGRVQNTKTLNLDKVADEIMGSSLYAGLQDFLSKNEDHNLEFDANESSQIWLLTKTAITIRLSRLRQSFYRINGLANALSNYPELTELCSYLTKSFCPTTANKLESQVQQMNESVVIEFLNNIVPSTCNFSNSQYKTPGRVNKHAI